MSTAAALTPVEVTPQQIKQWSDTRAALIWHAPAFTHILYTMMNKAGSEHIALFTNEVPVAATDGQNILINPETFFPLSLSERIFVVAHEISHGIFGHCEMMYRFSQTGKVHYPDGKELPFDADTMNRAMDYVINDMLIDSKLGTYKDTWLWDTTIATHMDSVLTAYRRIYQKEQGGGGGGGSDPNGNPGGNKAGKPGQQGFDKHLQPGQSMGQDPAQAANSRSEVEWKTAIAGAVASAKAQGKLPAALERLLGEVLNPEVDWTEKVQGWLNRKPGGGTYNWRSPDRRFITRNIIAPQRSGFGAGPMVVACDTSGSMWDAIKRFLSEMAGMLDDIRPTVIYVMWCDAEVHRVDEVYDAMDLHELRAKKAPGGGGTSFVPVFDKIHELGIEPDALVYLTDGEGKFPKVAPLYPVLWGHMNTRQIKYPWGDVVDVPIK